MPHLLDALVLEGAVSLEGLRAAAAAYPEAFPEELRSLAAGCCAEWEPEVLRLAAHGDSPADGSQQVLEAGTGLLLGRAMARVSPTAAEMLRRRTSEHAAMEDFLRSRAVVVRALLPR